MKAIMVMYDSLNRRMLSPYGCDWVHTPNFDRLAQNTVTFDQCYVGSMPCMPARREIHTGRYNFLHRSWGPIEPFDDSMPELLKNHGVYTHLVSDHYHYWEEGGCDYHTRYSSWEISRGQEVDPWKGDLRDMPLPPRETSFRDTEVARRNFVNRSYMKDPQEHSQHKTFEMGMEFLRTNHAADNWFLTIETFDPHEPYFSYDKYKELYPHDYDGPILDWPPYRRVAETAGQVQHLRYESAALHSMCDEYLGKVLDMMDELDLWKDTLLIVNTDHGFLLGEHDWWAKCCQPFYNEVAHIPLFIWDPRCGRRGDRCDCLTQTIDLAPTLLDYFGVPIPPDMQGRALRETIRENQSVRTAALFGLFGGHVNCTDGRYVYMRGSAQPDNSPLYEYTLMPTHMRRTFEVDELQDITLAKPFAFTKGCRTMRIPARPWTNPHTFGTMLFDVQADPQQENPLQDSAVEERMIRHMTDLMEQHDAPLEQYERLGLQDQKTSSAGIKNALAK